jgi:hypothetical protein
MASQSSKEPAPTCVATAGEAASQVEQLVKSARKRTILLSRGSGRKGLGGMATLRFKAGNELSLGGVIVNTVILGKYPSLIASKLRKTT